MLRVDLTLCLIESDRLTPSQVLLTCFCVLAIFLESTTPNSVLTNLARKKVVQKVSANISTTNFVTCLVPVPTYILGPTKEDHVTEYPVDESQFELCPNVYYLGKYTLYSCSVSLVCLIQVKEGFIMTVKD